MLRVSNRLTTLRLRRSAGRHVAERQQASDPQLVHGASRIAARIAQGGVALGLVASMGAVVLTADPATPPAVAASAEAGSLAKAAATRAADAYTTQLRAQAVEAAQAVVADASRVREDATTAAVPAEVLAELDAATAELQPAIVGAHPPAGGARGATAPRAADRGADDATAADVTAEGVAPDAAAVEQTDATVATEAAADPAVADPAAADPAASDPAADPAAAEDPADRLAEAELPITTDPATTPLRTALDRVKAAADTVVATTEQMRAEAAAAEAARVAAEQAAAQEAARIAAEQEAQRAAWKASLQGYANGKIPAEALCGLSFDARAQLRCDAAEALEALNAAYTAQFGTPISMTDSYRSYGAQVACRANKGSLCAAPGTSNHGWGLAVDLSGGIQGFGTAEHQWMRANAPAYQWVLPDWAQAGGSKPEPWHWEYVG